MIDTQQPARALLCCHGPVGLDLCALLDTGKLDLQRADLVVTDFLLDSENRQAAG